MVFECSIECLTESRKRRVHACLKVCCVLSCVSLYCLQCSCLSSVSGVLVSPCRFLFLVASLCACFSYVSPCFAPCLALIVLPCLSLSPSSRLSVCLSLVWSVQCLGCVRMAYAGSVWAYDVWSLCVCGWVGVQACRITHLLYMCMSNTSIKELRGLLMAVSVALSATWAFRFSPRICSFTLSNLGASVSTVSPN